MQERTATLTKSLAELFNSSHVKASTDWEETRISVILKEGDEIMLDTTGGHRVRSVLLL